MITSPVTPLSSRTAVYLPENTISAPGILGYRPIVCAKNLGARSGVGAHFSYGPKDDQSGLIEGILGNVKAMDYDRTSADVEFYLFHGDVEIQISTKDDDTFNNTLNSAGGEICSLFTSFIPYSNLVGSAKNLFTLIDSASEPAVASAGEALLRGYWSRIDVDGDGEMGKGIDNPVRTSTGDWSVYKTGISINVGQHLALYKTLSTKFQQRSEGYYDWGGLNGPPDLSAEIELKPYDTLQTYYKIKRD